MIFNYEAHWTLDWGWRYSPPKWRTCILSYVHSQPFSPVLNGTLCVFVAVSRDLTSASKHYLFRELPLSLQLGSLIWRSWGSLLLIFKHLITVRNTFGYHRGCLFKLITQLYPGWSSLLGPCTELPSCQIGLTPMKL
jgi:hypothetical protein